MDDELYQKGLAVREQMWGADAVRAKLDQTTSFQRDFEELVTRCCFGAVWDRPGLSRAERSMLTIAMMVALGRPEAMGNHVAGAVSNGVTRDQIREILLHAVPYCGIPAALEAFKTCERVLDELGAT